MKLILLIILFIYFADVVVEILALKCTSDEGLTTEEVRKVVRKCMKKNSDDGNQKNYDEYENFESDDDENDKQRGGGFDMSNSRRTNDRNRQHNNNYNSRPNNDQQQQGAGNNNNDMMNNRNDRNANQNNPYQSNNNNNNNRYNDNYNSNNEQNGNNGYNNNNNLSNNRNNNHNGSDKAEKDRSCILQCFFQELKMTNNEGFPDKHKALHVLTKELRDHELKDFYTDSIQECFHMIDLEQRRDKCQYSKNLITCLTERAKSNCADWNGNTVIF